jgi:two-component system response regulator AtoC
VYGVPKPEFAVKDAAAVVESLDGELFFLAASPAMKQIRAQVALIARTDVPVLLLGESGVGKEILARLIHKMSNRADRSLVKVNCAALPANLLESELFGYEAGAFTGANQSKPGNFELANKGSILLDEIGEMSAPLQAKLLHVLQDGQFSRLGGRADIKVDARIMAATNIDVTRAIAERRLREDLYYRLNALTITIPPLRERRQEIPYLLMHYIKTVARRFGKNPLPVSDRMLQACLQYHWPGNLRELNNFVQRYLVLEQEDVVLYELIDKTKGREVAERKDSTLCSHGGLKGLVRSLQDDVEAKEILRVLEDSNWNRKAAASRLRISYKALSYKMQQYKIQQQGLVPEEQKSPVSGYGVS